MWLHMVPFRNQVEKNSAPNLLGAQTGAAADQREERARRFSKCCQFASFLNIWEYI